jgi:hypothetical protein
VPQEIPVKKKPKRTPIPELGSLIYDTVSSVNGVVVYVGDGWCAYEFAAGPTGHCGYGCQSFEAIEINPASPSVITPDPFYQCRERIRQSIYAARAAAKRAKLTKPCAGELKNLSDAWDDITTALDFIGDTYNGRKQGGGS